MKSYKKHTLIAALMSLSAQVLSFDLFGPNHNQVIEKLPEPYINYQTIDDVSEFGNHTIQKFEHSKISDRRRFANFDGVPVFTEHAINKKTSNVIIKVTTRVDADRLKYTFYKLDVNGNTVDNHEFVHNFLTKESNGKELLVDATFLVNLQMAYYTTWPIDGNKTKIPFELVNQNLAWSDEQVQRFFADIEKQAARIDDVEVLESISPQENKKRIGKAYYLNKTGKWYLLHGNVLSNSRYESDSSQKSIVRGQTTLFSGFTQTDRFSKRYTPPANLSVPYFEKRKYSKYRAANNNGSGQYMVYTWEGLAYYNLKVGNDMLTFKNEAKLTYRDFGN